MSKVINRRRNLVGFLFSWFQLLLLLVSLKLIDSFSYDSELSWRHYVRPMVQPDLDPQALDLVAASRMEYLKMLNGEDDEDQEEESSFSLDYDGITTITNDASLLPPAADYDAPPPSTLNEQQFQYPDQWERDSLQQTTHYGLPFYQHYRYDIDGNENIFSTAIITDRSLASADAVLSTTDLQIDVTNTIDSGTAFDVNNNDCYPVNSGNSCNLRTAWDTCVYYSSSINSCTISLPKNSWIRMNVTLGALALSPGMSVFIVGNNATVQGIDNSYGQITSSTTFNGSTTSFPYITKTLSQTNSATVNYEQACLSICPGVTVRLSTCAGATIGDTYLRLYTANGKMVASNDNKCAEASEIVYQVPRNVSLSTSGSCPIYCLRMGCSGSKTCSMEVNAFYLRSNNVTEPAPQFISYIAPSPSSAPPSLTLSNFTITSFGSLVFVGAGAINITGNASLSMSHMIFRDNQATIGAAVAVVNNNYRQGFVKVSQSQFIHNCAMSEGGSFYLSYSSVPTHMDSLFIINNHASYGGFMSMNMNTSHVNLTNIETLSTSVTIYSSFLYTLKYANDLSISYFSLSNSYSYDRGFISFTNFSSKFLFEYANLDHLTSSLVSGIQFINNVSDITIRHTNWQTLYGSITVINTGTNVSNVIIEDIVVHDCSSTSSGGCIQIGNVINALMRDISMHRCIGLTKNPFSCIYLSSSSNIWMEYVTMSDSVSKNDGAFIGGNQNVKNATYQHMVLNNGTAGLGAPFILGTNSSSITVKNVTMSNCVAFNGGCLRFVRGKNATVHDVVLTNCTCKGKASAAGLEINQYPNMTISDVSISHSQSYGVAGGMGITQSSNITITNVAIKDCSVPISSSSGSMGGGLYINTLCNNISFANSSITGCSASLGGGIAINSYNNYVNLAGLTVTNNYASSKGGGIYVGQNNYELLMIDQEAFSEVKVIESSHPYAGKTQNPDGTRQIIYASNATFPGAKELIVNFDQRTTIQEIDLLNIYAFLPVSTSSSTTTTRKVLVYSGNMNFPGISIPSLRVPGSSIYVEFLGRSINSVIAIGLYGFRLYVYPVIHVPRYPMMVQGNIAQQKGGGIFFFYVNSFSVLINVIVQDNEVMKGDGGGISMQIGNGGTALQQVSFVNNSAFYDGGGLVLLSGQFGVSMKQCSFIKNTARSGSGGGLFLASSNGDGILVTRNNITCTLCRYENNTALNNGGAIYLSDENYISINTTTFLGNQVIQGDGGAIGLGGYGTAYFQDCLIQENIAKSCGGGLSAAKTSSIYLTNTSISSNEAMTSGGGICLYTGAEMTLRGKITVEGNKAEFVGGGIALFQSPLWNIDRNMNTRLIVSSNVASRGSAMSFFQLSSSKNQIDRTTFQYNVATQGSTVYWIYDSVMKTEPAGLSSSSSSSSSNLWMNNTVLYGGEVGTQAIHLIVPPVYNVTSYGAPVDPPITVQLMDYYHQIMTITGATTIYPTLVLGSEKCSQYPFLSGTNLFGSGVAMQQGIASFDNLEIYCSPSGNVTLSFQADIGSLTAVPQARRTPYYIKNTSFLSFRPCVAGEYETKGMCQTCPVSTYNLLDTPTYACRSCQSVDGVETCEGNQIVLKEGYWRRYPTSSAVMQCLLTPSSCTGGNMTSDDSCAEGYTGPLCAVCASNYFLSSHVCLPCDGGKNEMSPTAIAVLLIVFLLLGVVGVLIYYRYGRKREVQIIDPMTGEVVMSQLEPSSLELVFQWCKQKYNELMVKIKILVSTYQVIISTTTVFSVSMPVTFTKFANSLNFLNLGFTSIFPLGCSKDFTYFDSLLWTTLIPLLICALLALAFCIEYVSVRHKIQSNPNRQRGEKRKAFNRVKSKYLSFMFYLTYLVLPSVTTTIFQAFICTNIDPNNEDDSQYDLYLTADMSISCQSDEYYAWIPFVVVMILVYPIGIPMVYFFFLYSNKVEIRDRDEIIAERMKSADATTTASAEAVSDDTEVIAAPLNKESPRISTGGNTPGEKKQRRKAMTSSSAQNPLHRNSSKQTEPVITFAWEQANRQASGDVESGANGLDADDPDADSNEIDEESHLTVSATRLMFLWQSYKSIYWYFELVETTRRIMLTAVLSVCSPGSSSQSVLGVLLSFLYLLYYGIHQPYATMSDFVLAEIGQIQIFFTFFIALIVQNELLSTGWIECLGVVITIVNLSIVFLTCYYEVRNYQEERVRQQEEQKAVRQRVLSIVSAQKKMVTSKLLSMDDNNNASAATAAVSEGEREGTEGEGDGREAGEMRRPSSIRNSPAKVQFRKTSANAMMMLSSLHAKEEETTTMRASAGGIELQEFAKATSRVKNSMKSSTRSIKLDSDDESSDSDDE